MNTSQASFVVKTISNSSNTSDASILPVEIVVLYLVEAIYVFLAIICLVWELFPLDG